MVDKITLSSLANLQNESTAVNAINNNSATLVTAVNNTLSRDGTSPNQMGANLDMNGFQILNLGTTSYTFATLPSPGVLGRIAVITDSNTAVWGATAAAGGSNKVMVWYNGTNWTVIGK